MAILTPIALLCWVYDAYYLSSSHGNLYCSYRPYLISLSLSLSLGNTLLNDFL